MINGLKEVTVFLLPEGKQFTVIGNIKPVDMVGYICEEEITEVVDDCLVHCYTLKEELSSKVLFHPCGDCCYYGDCKDDYNDCEYASSPLSPSRELAARILGQLELYGSFYYKLEDWLTNCLEGNVTDLPLGIEGEYLRCALRIEVRDFFDSKDIEDVESEEIEECVDRLINHFSHSVLDMDFISDIVDEYIKEREEK